VWRFTPCWKNSGANIGIPALLLQARRSIECDDAAFVDDGNAVAQTLGFLYVVRGHVLHPADRIGPIAALEALYLTFTQLQQTGGFAYAQPPACCLLNYFSLVGTLSDSSSPSLEGDKVSLQLWGDIILEHLHGSLFPLPSRIFSARIPTQDDASEVVILLTRPKRSALN